MIKLSIIIPIYNVESYLSACLDSAVDPAVSDYEILAVNDGSTDGSGEILAAYARRFPGLVHPVTTPNGGLGHARNTGLALAKGEYVLFLDSDDCLTPGAVGEMLACLDGSFDVGLFDFVTVNEQGRQLSETKGSAREGTFTLAEYPELLFEAPNAVNKLWRRSLFLDSGVLFPDRIWFEDLATIPRLYLNAGQMRYLARPWYRYLQRSGSITNSAHAERNLEMLTALGMSLDYYRERGAYAQYEPQLCRMAAWHELIASTTRVNLIDPESEVQDRLLEDFTRRFPNWQENPYIRNMGKKYRLLIRLITQKRRRELNLLMRANNAVKQKNR